MTRVMQALALVGVAIVGALLAHHGAPWLAFALGCGLLTVVCVLSLLSVPEGP